MEQVEPADSVAAELVQMHLRALRQLVAHLIRAVVVVEQLA